MVEQPSVLRLSMSSTERMALTEATVNKQEGLRGEKRLERTGELLRSSTGGATKYRTFSSTRRYWPVDFPKYFPGAPVRKPGTNACLVPVKHCQWDH